LEFGERAEFGIPVEGDDGVSHFGDEISPFLVGVEAEVARAGAGFDGDEGRGGGGKLAGGSLKA
jgi:hypothetical protein